MTAFMDILGLLRPEDLLQAEQVSRGWRSAVWRSDPDMGDRFELWFEAALREGLRSSSGSGAKAMWAIRSAARRLARGVFVAPARHPAVLAAIATFSWPLSLSGAFVDAAMESAGDSSNAALLLGISTCSAYRSFAYRVTGGCPSPPEDGLVLIASALEPLEARGARQCVADLLEAWAAGVRTRLFADHGSMLFPAAAAALAAGVNADAAGIDPGAAWVAALVAADLVPWRALVAAVRAELFDAPPAGAGFFNGAEGGNIAADDEDASTLSIITHVLRRRRGLPIMVCVVFEAVARLAGLGAIVEASSICRVCAIILLCNNLFWGQLCESKSFVKFYHTIPPCSCCPHPAISS